MKRAVLHALLAAGVLAGAAASCTNAATPQGQGGTCQLTTDCQQGYVCIQQADGTRQCSNDLTPIQGTLDAGGGADATMAQDGATPADGTTPQEGAPPAETGGPPQDTGSPPQDTGSPPKDTGSPPQDTGSPPQEGGGGGDAAAG